MEPGFLQAIRQLLLALRLLLLESRQKLHPTRRPVISLPLDLLELELLQAIHQPPLEQYHTARLVRFHHLQ